MLRWPSALRCLSTVRKTTPCTVIDLLENPVPKPKLSLSYLNKHLFSKEKDLVDRMTRYNCSPLIIDYKELRSLQNTIKPFSPTLPPIPHSFTGNQLLLYVQKLVNRNHGPNNGIVHTILDQLLHSEKLPRAVLECLIQHYAENSELDKVDYILDRMEQENTQPTVRLLNRVLSLVSVSPNNTLFVSKLNYLIHFVKQFRRFNVPTNHATFIVVFRALKLPKSRERLLQFMRKKTQAVDLEPVSDVLLDEAILTRRIDLDELVSDPSGLTVGNFNVVFAHLLRIDPQMAVQLFKTKFDDGPLLPDKKTVDIITEHLMNQGRYFDLIANLRLLESKYKVSPNSAYLRLLRTLTAFSHSDPVEVLAARVLHSLMKRKALPVSGDVKRRLMKKVRGELGLTPEEKGFVAGWSVREIVL